VGLFDKKKIFKPQLQNQCMTLKLKSILK